MTREALSRIGQPSRAQRVLTDLGTWVAAAALVVGIAVATFALGVQVTP